MDSFNDFNEEIKVPHQLPFAPREGYSGVSLYGFALFVGREGSINAVDEALNGDRLILLASQSNPDVDEPKRDDIYKTGTVGIILRMIKLSDGRVKILVQGIKRACVSEFLQDNPYYKVSIDELNEPNEETYVSSEALVRHVKEQVSQAVDLGKPMLPDFVAFIESISNPGKLADLLVSNMGLPVSDAQTVLEQYEPLDRLKRVSELLNKEISILEVQYKIMTDAKGEIDKSQREYFLRAQLRAIRKELGEDDDINTELEDFEEKIRKAKLPKEPRQEALKQLKRLSKMHQEAAEATVVRTYLDWMVELPWNKSTKDELDIFKARDVLNEDHHSLFEVKERILDFLAVLSLKKDVKSPILCFIGPPGVGKTSLGKSIARAMGRKFVRMSFGGMRDEAEIRGHRRTYVGAMPGKVIQGLKSANSRNAVMMLDEIDKLGFDFRGDPASALLEVLDPVQNEKFTDHYLGVPFDLSNIFFITTANYMDPIPAPLLDRMEVIRLPGYTLEEKVSIATRYLVPRQLEENGIASDNLHLSANSLTAIVDGYTREAGLRELERAIGTVCRKIARKISEGGDAKAKYRVTGSTLHKYLGPVKYHKDSELKDDEVGIATGLAWTPVGGEVLFVEAIRYKGKGALINTGQLGDVMKESATAALSCVRTLGGVYPIDEKVFSDYDMHIHVPSGAIPKDGPSAGITMATAILSLVTGLKVRKDIAMTGEITITGKVLPIGGLKEKILAARRFGIKRVIIPERNKSDIHDLPQFVKKSVDIVTVNEFREIAELALDND